MAEDFTDLYVLNLRGNQRTAGEQSRKEGGKVFGSGSRNTVAITIGVKDPSKHGFDLHYRDIGDYLSATEKLEIVENSTVENMEWQQITPNKVGDWLNQRSEEFETWPVIGEKAGGSLKVFDVFSAGLKTGRDTWAYAQTDGQLVSKLGVLIGTYTEATASLRKWLSEQGITKPQEKDVTVFLQAHPQYANTTKASWNRTLKNLAAKGTEISVRQERIYASQYRPFTKKRVYFEPSLNDMTYRLPSLFPTPKHRNIGFVAVGAGESVESSVLATELLPDLHVIATSQYFPRFTWAAVEADDGGLFGEGGVVKQGEASVYGSIGEVIDGYVRVDNITDEIKTLYRDVLGADITGDDIFHFVYGKLHDPVYRTKYAADLKKMLPHIETPSSRAEFDKFAAAGQELMSLHVNYETVDPWPLDIQVTGDEADRETWRVLKMKWAKRKDPETGKNVNDVTKLIYNKRVTIAGIPEEADEYMLGSRSAVAWLIDRYQVKKDKASGIVNDPNDWADEVGNPRYIVDLIGKVVRVAMETVRIVDGLNSK
ncbi:TPA: damage-inducible protein, partial [Corynebacterium aurimucosum]|nr:damage-inducible protein [Corynebacterium aurimucosum]